MKKARNKIIAVTALIIALLLFIAYFSSYSLALSSIGFKKNSTSDIFQGIDPNGYDYRVVMYKDEEDSAAFALLTKDSIGIWKVSLLNDRKSELGMVSFGWTGVRSLARYDMSEDVVPMGEYHAVYAGNNAIAPLKTIYEILPPNITVDIQQAGSSYVMHFMSYGPFNLISNADVIELLTEHKYIE